MVREVSQALKVSKLTLLKDQDSEDSQAEEAFIMDSVASVMSALTRTLAVSVVLVQNRADVVLTSEMVSRVSTVLVVVTVLFVLALVTSVVLLLVSVELAMLSTTEVMLLRPEAVITFKAVSLAATPILVSATLVPVKLFQVDRPKAPSMVTTVATAVTVTAATVTAVTVTAMVATAVTATVTVDTVVTATVATVAVDMGGDYITDKEQTGMSDLSHISYF